MGSGCVPTKKLKSTSKFRVAKRSQVRFDGLQPSPKDDGNNNFLSVIVTSVKNLPISLRT